MVTERPTARTNVGRRLEILECLMRHEAAGEGGLGVVAAAAALGREKSQVSRGLLALAASGLAERLPGAGDYVIGPRLLELAAEAGDPDLLRRVRPVCRRLVGDFSCRVQVVALVGRRAMTIETCAPVAAGAVQTLAWTGMEAPLHCTASGRALLFDTGRDELEQLAGDRLHEGGPASPHSPAELWARLERERKAGFATAVGELEQELAAVAAPIRSVSGLILAALALSGPRSRLEAGLARAGRAVREEGRKLSSS